MIILLGDVLWSWPFPLAVQLKTSFNTEPKTDSMAVGLSFKQYSFSVSPRSEAAEKDLKKFRVFLQRLIA